MKYLLCCLLVLHSAVSAKAQKIDSAAVARLSTASREQVNHYLLAAKKAKTTAMIMCFGGGALMIAGGVMGLQAIRNDGATPDPNPYDSINVVPGDNALGNAGAVIFWVGAASALGSIPFFVKSHKKANAARAILFTDKGVLFTPGIIMPGTGSAGIRLVVPLGK